MKRKHVKWIIFPFLLVMTFLLFIPKSFLSIADDCQDLAKAMIKWWKKL